MGKNHNTPGLMVAVALGAVLTVLGVYLTSRGHQVLGVLITGVGFFTSGLAVWQLTHRKP